MRESLMILHESFWSPAKVFLYLIQYLNAEDMNQPIIPSWDKSLQHWHNSHTCTKFIWYCGHWNVPTVTSCSYTNQTMNHHRLTCMPQLYVSNHRSLHQHFIITLNCHLTIPRKFTRNVYYYTALRRHTQIFKIK